MELGFDAVLVNTAVAQARDPVAMAARVRPGGGGRSRRARWRVPSSRATSRTPSTPVIGTGISRMTLRARLSDRRQRRLGGAAAATGRAPGAAAHQGHSRKRSCAREIRGARRHCAAARHAAGRQRLLAARARGAVRLRASRAGGSRSAPTCRRAAPRRRAARRQHARPRGARAGARLRPDYVALGPIYPTLLKVMPWQPQGLERLSEWKRRIGAIPLVAIGGLTLERLRGRLCRRRGCRRRGDRHRQELAAGGPRAPVADGGGGRGMSRRAARRASGPRP